MENILYKLLHLNTRKFINRAKVRKVPCRCVCLLQPTATAECIWFRSKSQTLAIYRRNWSKIVNTYRSSQIPQHHFSIIWCRDQVKPWFIVPFARWYPRIMWWELEYRRQSSWLARIPYSKNRVRTTSSNKGRTLTSNTKTVNSLATGLRAEKGNRYQSIGKPVCRQHLIKNRQSIASKICIQFSTRTTPSS